MNKYAFMKLVHQQNNVVAPPSNTSRHWSSLSVSSTTSKTLSLLSFLHNSSLQEDSCMHSLWQFFKYFQVFEPLRLCTLPVTTVFQQFHSGCNSKTSLSLRTPCMAPVLNLHFCENENNVIPPELAEMNSHFCQRTPCGQFRCTPCRKTLAQTEKQLKVISLLSLSSDSRH
jgi:hypothetical protein